MWLLAVNGLVYLALGIATGRFRRKLLPLRAGEVVADTRLALRGQLSHDDLAVYNALQKLLYLGVIVAGIVIVLSGLAMWKPVQFWWLAALFGGYEPARYVHFFAMAAIVGFPVMHVVMAFVVPKSAARHDHWDGETLRCRASANRSPASIPICWSRTPRSCCPIRRGGCSCAAA